MNTQTDTESAKERALQERENEKKIFRDILCMCVCVCEKQQIL